MSVSPQYLEYSEKDDRFRLAAEGYRPLMLNLSRLEICTLLEKQAFTTGHDFRHSRSLTMELTDERDTLARVLLHFSHLEKEIKRLDDTHYRVILQYDGNDETEMLIRILSFGPVVQVTEPESFRQKLRERLAVQERFQGTVPAPEFHRGVALLLSSQSRIPFSGGYELVKLHSLTSQSPHPKRQKSTARH